MKTFPMKTLRALALAGLLAVVVAALHWSGGPTVRLDAQAAITSTTTSAAVTRTQTTVPLTSDSGVAAGTKLFIDLELVEAVSEVGTTGRWNVRRGLADGGSPATGHASGSKVWIFPNSSSGSLYFTYDQASGATCAQTDYPYVPFINTKTGHVFDCAAGLNVWEQRNTSNMKRPLELTLQESFDEGYSVMQDDGTVKSVSDAEENFVCCSVLGAIEYREEQAKTVSSWLTANGYLDISADNTTDNEGVEIIWGATSDAALNQWLEAGTQGGCISASITLTDISGTDQIIFGFRDNAAFVDVAAYATYTVWTGVGVVSTAGAIKSQNEVSASTQTDDPGVVFADGETRAVRSCISKAGIPTAFYTDAYTPSQVGNDYVQWKQITLTNGGTAMTAGTGMIPYMSYLAAGTDGPDVHINWVRLTRIP